MPALRTTKAEIKRLTTNPSTKQIIDGLWRAPLWMHDEVLLSPDDEAKTEAGASFDARYVYAENSFLDDDNNQVSFASAEGFGNSMQASFAHVFGFFNTATSFAETIIGTHGLTGLLQTANDWIVTDRLFTIANGADANNRSDAWNMYKSGFSIFKNATAFGPYSHGTLTPPNGAFQFDNAFKGFWDNAWHTFVTTDQLSGMHPPVSLDPESSVELWVNENQVIGIDLSAYAKTANLHPAVSLGTGSETELALNPTTQVLTLTGLKKTFLSLNDTFDAYPAGGLGYMLISGDSSVLYSQAFGSDSEGAWAQITPEIENVGSNILTNQYFSPSTGWTIGSPWIIQSFPNSPPYDYGAYFDATGSGIISQQITLESGKTYRVKLFASDYETTPLVEILIDGSVVAIATEGDSSRYSADFESTITGTATLGIKATSPGTLAVFNVTVSEVTITAGRGLRMCNSGHATQYILPTSAPSENDVVFARADGQLVFGQINDFLPDTFILDTDFPTAGLMLTDGAGNYSVITDNSAIWNTALVDADFASNGLMVRTGAGTYSTVADNSATWNTLASLGTKTFWNGTQAAYDAIGTKDSNTIYFINV